MHAVGFIGMASTSLLVLFYFKIYGVVKVMYALGCSKAVSQIMLTPLCLFICKRARVRDRVVWRTGTEDFGDITVVDIIAHAVGYSLGLTWLVVSFTVRHPDSMPFYWIMQDVFGASMCMYVMVAACVACAYPLMSISHY
jgi:hypothetical protein